MLKLGGTSTFRHAKTIHYQGTSVTLPIPITTDEKIPEGLILVQGPDGIESLTVNVESDDQGKIPLKKLIWAALIKRQLPSMTTVKAGNRHMRRAQGERSGTLASNALLKLAVPRERNSK